MRYLRFTGESDDAFRRRAERTAAYAEILTDAALANDCIRRFIDDSALPYTEESQRRDPTVRVEFDEAFAIGGIGECLQATRNKHWGDGPYIQPLSPDDPVDPMFILYVYKPGSVYNRRFEQRRRMKELLGREHRKLVERAKYRRSAKKMFLESLTESEAHAIKRILNIDPGEFWRAARGKVFVALAPRQVQLELPFEDE